MSEDKDFLVCASDASNKAGSEGRLSASAIASNGSSAVADGLTETGNDNELANKSNNDSTPAPSWSELRARLDDVMERIEELIDDDCGCASAIGYDSDGEVRHSQIDCTYEELDELKWEKKQLIYQLRSLRRDDIR
ncbi:hypothetical protein CVT26_007716 [Gymnopilus dilepis]|uniref:Uncharacterized protein n=1 Tax=Gymnopilus dilepis TaxID=231916 RepID=A0A409X2R2_9AGAR|nr:hypothetical protein CVT26_007716 [Gymnopilus dilepis]